MGFMPPIHSPKTAFKDFLAFARRREREQVIGAVLALLMTAIIVVLVLLDSRVNTAPPAQVTYVEIYDSDRTDEEIMARQQADQRAIEERARARQEEFQRLDNALEDAGF